jgi:cytochrome c-type biogenesis protein CcmE
MEKLKSQPPESTKSNSRKFILGGIVIVGAIIYLILSSLSANVQYFLTIEEVLSKQAAGVLEGRNIRVSGAVIGDTIQYNMDTLELKFTIVHVPGDNQLLEQEGGLARALHNAVMDPNRPSLDVIYYGPRPDLLQNEAQAVITGEMVSTGVMEADEILLKCPTKYESSLPDQADSDR